MGTGEVNIWIKSCIYIVLSLLLSSLFNPLVLITQETDAGVPPDEDKNSGGNGTADFAGTWYIGTGQGIIRANQTLNLSGDLVINNTGRLVLYNFTLQFNNSYDGEFNIIIQPGGTLELINNSIVTTRNDQNRFAILVNRGGSIIINASTISSCGWDLDNPGLVVEFDPQATGPTNSSITNSAIRDGYNGLTLYNSNIALLIYNNTITNHSHAGIMVVNCTGLNISYNNLSQNRHGVYSENSTVFIRDNHILNNSGWGIYSAGSQVNVNNNTFNLSGGLAANARGRLWQQYYLDLQVNDSMTLEPIPDVIITVEDNMDNLESIKVTDLAGRSSGINLTHFRIFNNNTNQIFTPHNVTLEKTGYETAYISPEPDMASNQNLQVLLTKDASQLPLDYIVIERTPGGHGEWVGSGNYGVGEIDIFYCAGYNHTYGFVGVVNATWSVSNVSLASINVSGNSTVFTIKPVPSGGILNITAWYNGLKNTTGTITIDPATEDYIMIVDSPAGNGVWVDSRTLPTFFEETFYCSVFNDTIGYLEDVNVSWTVFNPYVGQVKPEGFSTVFFGLAEGETRVQATYIPNGSAGLTNTTGDIRVKEFVVDSIIIRDKPGNGGSWVGPGDYNDTVSLSFYCAGYNVSWGYLHDVSVQWNMEGDYVGYLAPSHGESTELVVTESGIIYIKATLGGLTNQTGLLRFYSSLPDLEVNDFDITLSPSDTEAVDSVKSRIQIRVRNRGGSHDSSVLLNVYNSTFENPALNLLVEAELQPFGRFQTRYYNLSWTPAFIGLNSIHVYVDEGNSIAESNEDNNIAERKINVRPYLPDLVKIIIDPVNVEVEAGTAQKFSAIGFFQDNSSRPLIYPEIRWQTMGGAKINSTGHFFSLKSDAYNVTVSSGKISNMTRAYVVAGPLAMIEVFPDHYELDIGDTRKFIAYGYDQYYNGINISPEWDVSGGGTVNNDGEFVALTPGTWQINATVGDISGNASIIVHPYSLDLVKVMLFPSKLVLFVGGEFQFVAVGIDREGEEHMLTPFWKTNGGGVISTNGYFNATEKGRWTVTATKGGAVGTAEVIIDPGAGVMHFETFTDPRTGVRVSAEFTGWGTFWVNRLTTPGSTVKIPYNYVSVNRFYEIIKTEHMIIDWALVHIPYSLGDIPEAYIGLEINLKLYFWSEQTAKWIKTGGSSVDMNSYFVFGNVSHFSIFGAMIDLSEGRSEDGQEEPIYSTAILTIIVILVALIIFVLCMIILVQYRPQKMEHLIKVITGRDIRISGKRLPPKSVSTIRYKKKVKERVPDRDEPVEDGDEDDLEE